MTIKTTLLTIGLACLFSPIALANTAKEGDIISVTLDQLRPSQPSVGYDQVMYKLGRYQFDRKKMFDEICETNGQKGIKTVTSSSQPNISDSFQCKQAIGQQTKDMKTIAIAPNGEYYLTDGHHTFNVFYQMPQGGADFAINVLVDKDYSHLKTMANFWQAMKQDGNAWLFDHQEQPITYNELPKTLGLTHFNNDIYRSLMYFSRDIGWNKPKNPVPFLEFYWTKELRQHINANNLNLDSMAGYAQAIEKTSKQLLSIKTDNVGGSHLTTKQMGQFEQFNQKGLDKLLRENGKVDYMLRYKTASAEH